jgi:kinesin family protein 5
MSTELNTLRVSAGRLEDEAKDIQILVDSYKERIAELQKDIEDHKTQIEELKHAQAREKEEEKEKRKQEMLNDMMSRIDMVNFLNPFILGIKADDLGRPSSRHIEPEATRSIQGARSFKRGTADSAH